MNYLYHGTSSKHLKSVLKNGLKPRGAKKGNWTDYPSRLDMVYFTTAYAPYFAINSCKNSEKALIVEVDTLNLGDNLYPDEDFIAQVIACQQNKSIEEVHEEIRDNLEDYQHHFSDSLEGLGNCSYMGTVSARCITRYVLLDYNKSPELGMACLDPCISLMNYKFCGNRYRSIISWLFGDREDFEIGIGDNKTFIEMIEKTQPGYRERLETLFANKEGIEVFSTGSPARAA